MASHSNEEDTVVCPIDGCDQEVTSRGLYMHIFHTNDPDGEGHYPKYSLPPDIDENEIKISGKQEIEIDYPETQDLDERHFLDTYTGKAYKGKRGLMVHLGQLAGRDNIPNDVTDRHDAMDFPIVEVDEDGNIIEVIKYAEGEVPALEPYLPWYTDDEEGFVPRQKIADFVNELKEGSGAATAEQIEKKLLS